MNRNIFGGNAGKSAFNGSFSDRNTSGCDIFKVVQEILVQGGIPDREARAEANLIVTEVSGLRIEEIIAGKRGTGNVDTSESGKAIGVFPADTIEKIIDIAKRRAETRAPIQHILGFAYFMGDKFFVDKNVLIPRPETELLVRCSVRVIREIMKVSGDCTKTAFDSIEKAPAKRGVSDVVNILDIGTGTGCIPIEISKTLPDVPMELVGVDISTDALRMAIKNMETLGQQRRVIFRKSDIFSGLRPIDKFHIIVSNPPYIPISAKETLQNEVKNFDPALALFTNDKFGIEFYRRILEGAKEHLNPGGYVLFELGFTEGVSQAAIVAKLGQKFGFKLEFIEKDLSEIERVICFCAK